MSIDQLFSKHYRGEGPEGSKPPEDGGGKRTPQFMAPRPLKTLAFWLMMTVLVLLAVNVYQLSKPEEHKITFGEFYEQVLAGNIHKVTISSVKATGELSKPIVLDGDNRGGPIERFYTTLPAEADTELWKEIRQYNPNVDLDGEVSKPNWFGIVLSYLPIILIIGFWLFFMRQMQSGGSAAMRFGKSKAKLLIDNKPKVTFRDVAGADEAKEELQEIIEFLSDPKKFQALGGRIPKGALLLGPPGTGKTLLAKAVAGEAGVPFFSMSGSDFVEMFVGVGASRVRDLFEQGKRNAPCIMFIDEIDAVGRHRGAGLGGGHDEREQTLNQLLVEMDGFESNEGVILLAATNRPDVLDPALLRPGRFDRQVVVDAPDVKGREGILKVHTRKVPLSADVELHILARGTPGMVGADLANMVNEAALLAARRNHRRVTMRDFEDAKDKVMMGAERKSRVFSDEEKKVTAYHEAGHAIVGWMTPDADPIHKVTIIPRGRAMGVTYFLPIDDRHTYSRKYCLGVLARAMGGRAAEELVFNQITTGAGNDIEQATNLARRMVCEWGMSDAMGPVSYRDNDENIFLGKEFGHTSKISGTTQKKIDEEIHRLVDEAHQKALTILKDNMDKLDSVADALLEREILGSEEIDQLMEGKELDPPAPLDTGEEGSGFDPESLPPLDDTEDSDPYPGSDPDPQPGPA